MTTYEIVSKNLANQLNISEDKIAPTSEIVKDLGADSLDVVELIMSLEDEFNITLPEEGLSAENATVQDIVNFIDANK